MFNPTLESDLIDESKPVLGIECCTCFRILPFSNFRRDSSYKTGYRPQCNDCASTEPLSVKENALKLSEQNYNSEALKKQRVITLDDYETDAARIGHPLHHSDFLLKLLPLVPNLYICEGRIQGDLALYKVFPQPQSHLEGRTFQYLGYCPTGMIPEFSLWEFDSRDVPVRERERGYRTVLLTLIIQGMLTEEKVNQVFGRPEGPGSLIYRRKLSEWRNRNNKI
jgi:hypothetical protein